MTAPDVRDGAFEPAVVKIQRAGEARDGQLASAVLALWDLIKRALDLSGEEAPDPAPISALRDQLAATDRREWAEGHAKRMAESHQAARRQSGTPPVTRFDGSRQQPLDDERELAFARERMLSGGQAARHAQMAAANPYPGDGSDAHMGTRAEREEIYRKLQEEGR